VIVGVLVSNAGVGVYMTVSDSATAEAAETAEQQMISLNVKATTTLTRLFAQHMLKYNSNNSNNNFSNNSNRVITWPHPGAGAAVVTTVAVDMEC